MVILNSQNEILLQPNLRNIHHLEKFNFTQNDFKIAEQNILKTLMESKDSIISTNRTIFKKGFLKNKTL